MSEACPQCGGRGSESHSWDDTPERCAGCNGTGVAWDEIDRLRGLLNDAVVVIERMANGASRRQCSPELDRVIAYAHRESPR